MRVEEEIVLADALDGAAGMMSAFVTGRVKTPQGRSSVVGLLEVGPEGCRAEGWANAMTVTSSNAPKVPSSRFMIQTPDCCAEVAGRKECLKIK